MYCLIYAVLVPKQRLSFFAYQFDKGPVLEAALSAPIAKGNCRLAAQDFLFVFAGRYFNESELLNPGGYLTTGTFLKQAYAPDFFEGLPTGAVLYAESIRTKNGVEVDKSPSRFATRDDYLISLHTAVFIRELDDRILKILPANVVPVATNQPAIWHATVVEGATCLWTIEKFLEFYKPVAAKLFV